MKTARLFYFILLISQITQAQWEWQSPLPQGNTLLDIQFTDTSNGWAVGEYGTLIHTTDGGKNWISQEYGRTDDLLSLKMISTYEGWVVGDNGTIMHTSDGGDNWIEQTSPVTGGMNSIFFFDQLNGWAAGDRETILHTVDGGINWTIQQESFGSTSINSILFLTLFEGWAVGSKGKIFHTTDGGNIWTPQTIGSMGTVFQHIIFVDPSLGFIVGSDGMILRTENGGSSWSTVNAGESTNFNRICMANTFVGWIAGDGGRLLRTVNGGLSWSGSTIGSGENLNGISRGGNYLWVSGEYGKIFKSVNNGISWNSLDSGTRLSINWLNFASNTTATAVGQSGLLLQTTDGGMSWRQLTSPTPTLSSFGVFMIDETHGCAVGEGGNILKTSDGTTWLKQSSPTAHTLFGVTFADQSNGWIVGGDQVNYTGFILKTTNGGANWAIQNSSMPHMVYGVDFISATTGWVVGDFGIIYKTTNGGTTWNPQSSGTGAVLYWCDFSDQNNGWAIGDSGTIIRTTNGGTSWIRQNSGTNFILFSVVQNGLNEAVAVGDSGLILQTTDAGLNWTKEYSRTANPLYSVSNNGKYMAAGDFGTILSISGPDQLGTVSGTVFLDLNQNGSYDVDESGMAGWEITLAGGRYEQSISDGNGKFSFAGLPMGEYTITQRLKPGWTNTVPASPSGYSFSMTILSNEYSCVFGNHASSFIPVDIKRGWNIISLPLIVPDPSFSTLYPSAISSAYYFDNAYKPSDTLTGGIGYWTKFPFDFTNYLIGTPFTTDTVEIKSGWNIVGSVSEPVSIDKIRISPPGATLSFFFTYDAGYYPSDTLVPGRGYWVKSSDAGNLIINPPTDFNIGHKQSFHYITDSLNSLTVSDGSGSSQRLYFTSKEYAGPRNLSEIPPLPPGDAFDARFDGSSLIYHFDGLNEEEKGTISIQSYRPPLRLDWRIVETGGGSFSLCDGTEGNMLAELNPSSGSVIIHSDEVKKLRLAFKGGMNRTDLPMRYSLGQNYPNPFNPSTSFEYQLPNDCWVTIKIYNLIGEAVSTLVNSPVSAGSHTVHFNAGNLPSGVYYYRLTAGRYFTDIKRMIIIK